MDCFSLTIANSLKRVGSQVTLLGLPLRQLVSSLLRHLGSSKEYLFQEKKIILVYLYFWLHVYLYFSFNQDPIEERSDEKWDVYFLRSQIIFSLILTHMLCFVVYKIYLPLITCAFNFFLHNFYDTKEAYGHHHWGFYVIWLYSISVCHKQLLDTISFLQSYFAYFIRHYKLFVFCFLNRKHKCGTMCYKLSEYLTCINFWETFPAGLLYSH